MPLPFGVEPRPYQKEQFQMLRESLRENRATCLESPTGSGKSVLAASVVDAFEEMNKLWKLDRHIYFLVGELFLLSQFSEHLEKWKIRHDVIGGGKYEGRPVNVHVATVQTLRKHPPKNEPALFIVDEAQWSTSQTYLQLFADYPNAKIIGITASPEGPGGKGLSKKSTCGIFDTLIKSPVTMKDLTELGYLCPISYWAVPTRDYDNVSLSKGDYNISEIEKLMAEKGIFGDAVKQIERFPNIKSHILVFCKSVKACYDMQTVFLASGWSADVLEGSITKKNRKKIMNRFESGDTKILVTCKMVLQGVDIPALNMCVDLAPTVSRMIWRQKVGRVARTFPGKEFGYYLDMVGNIQRATKTGDVYENIEWRFDSEVYNKKPGITEAADVFCPVCYGYLGPTATVCPWCGAAKQVTPKKEKEEKTLEGDLVEAKIIPLKERPLDERREVMDAVRAAVRDQNIERLREIGAAFVTAKKLPFWVYHQMNEKKNILDIPLLYKIQRSFEFKPGWVFYAKKMLHVEKKEAELWA